MVFIVIFLLKSDINTCRTLYLIQFYFGFHIFIGGYSRGDVLPVSGGVEFFSHGTSVMSLSSWTGTGQLQGATWLRMAVYVV